MKFLDALERIALVICMFIIIIGALYLASISGANKEYNDYQCEVTTGNKDCGVK